MLALYQMIETVAQVPSTVLVTGESGTERTGRARDSISVRGRRNPFVSVNCSAFTETLLESELFGYVKGSFTGANANARALKLRTAGRSSSTRSARCRRRCRSSCCVLRRKVRPVGATEEGTVDTRVIAATNRDLASMVGAGTFREDLYYRISVIPIELPPLRKRAEDISDLATHFVQKFCAPTGRTLSVSLSAMRLLEAVFVAGQRTRGWSTRSSARLRWKGPTSRKPERLPEKISNYNPYRVAEAMEFPDEGSTLRPIWTNSKRRMCSRRFAARQVIRRMPLSCSGCLFVHCVIYWTNTASAADRTDARRASWSRLAPAPPLLRSSAAP